MIVEPQHASALLVVWLYGRMGSWVVGNGKLEGGKMEDWKGSCKLAN